MAARTYVVSETGEKKKDKHTRIGKYTMRPMQLTGRTLNSRTQTHTRVDEKKQHMLRITLYIHARNYRSKFKS